MNEFRKIIIAVITSVCVATLGAAAKSFVDVEKLKVEVGHVYGAIIDIKSDIKEIKLLMLKQRKDYE